MIDQPETAVYIPRPQPEICIHTSKEVMSELLSIAEKLTDDYRFFGFIETIGRLSEFGEASYQSERGLLISMQAYNQGLKPRCQ
jgi:hypothetical protein